VIAEHATVRPPVVDRNTWAARLVRWRAAWGPGWLVMIADVDAASVLTALETGATYRYEMIWFLLALTIPLFFIQEAAGRIGAVTKKGLGTLARENYTRRQTWAVVLPMAGADVATYVAEYAGIAIGLGLFGISPLVSLPLAFALHIGIVAHGRYVWAERILLGVSAGLILVIVATLLLRGVPAYSPPVISASPSYLFLLAANAGAVVMPFMLFFQSSATAEKQGSVRFTRNETLVGAVVSEGLMIALVMVAAGVGGTASFTSAHGLASAISPLAGAWAPYLLGAALVAAAFLALVVISLGSAWGVVEALGLRRDRTLWIYVAESVPAVVVPILFPHLITLVLVLMVLMVFVLVGPGILVGQLSASEKLMGPHASRGVWRWAYWASLGFILLFGVLAVTA